MIVQHNITAMNANRMLGMTTNSLSKSTEKLSSGYRINRAADDAAGLTISEKMRKQIRGLDQASTNAEDGVSAVQTAEGALTEVHSMLQRMNELAVQAANGTNSQDDRKAIQDEISQLTTEIDRVSETTKFNETYLLKGEAAGNTTPKKINAHDAGLKGTLVDNNDGTATFTVAALNNGDKVTIADTEYTIGAAGAGTAAATTFTGTTGITVTGTYSGTTDAVYTYDGTNWKDATGTTINLANVGLTVNLGGKTLANGDKITATAATAGTAPAGKITADEAYTKMVDELIKASSIGTDTAAQVTNTNNVFTITKGSANVTKSLSFNLHVGADADMTNKINVNIDAMSAAGLGIKGIDVTDATGVKATYAIDAIADAISTVSSQRSALGAVQNRLEHTIDNLDNVVENTTSAESRIRDTDMAEEMVDYSKNNILQQAGQSMLAQANQANQGVLSLLQ